MNKNHEEIIVVLSKSHLPADLSTNLLDSTFLTIENSFFLVSDNWIANLVSFMTSTMPSFHGIRNTEDAENKRLILTESFINMLGSANIETDVFIQDEDLKRLAFLKLKDESIPAENHAKVKLFIISRWERTLAEKISRISSKNSFVLMIPLSSEERDNLIPMHVKNVGRKIMNTWERPFHAIIDIPPMLFTWMGLKLPYTWIKIAPNESRDAILVERGDRQNILIVEDHKIVIPKENYSGEIYDLNKDPQEKHDLWDDPGSLELKSRLLIKFLSTKMGNEPMPMPRISAA